MVPRSLFYAPATHSKVLITNSCYERFEKALRSDSGYLRASTEPGQGGRQPAQRTLDAVPRLPCLCWSERSAPPGCGIGWQAPLVSDPPTHCGAESGCTTEARNTHKTELREIAYLWHPWHGQRVLVRGAARRGGGIVLRCVRDDLKGFPILEIPEWMFDFNLCGRMKPAQRPRVDCAALLALKHLLSTATGCGQQDMVQAQQDSCSSGDADAQAESAQEPSRRVIFSSRETPRVTHRGAAKDGPTVGQDIERTLASPLRGHDPGGGR